jgi:hypothetical protein
MGVYVGVTTLCTPTLHYLVDADPQIDSVIDLLMFIGEGSFVIIVVSPSSMRFWYRRWSDNVKLFNNSFHEATTFFKAFVYWELLAESIPQSIS